MRALNLRKLVCIVAAISAATITSASQDFSNLVNFQGDDGSQPLYTSLTQGVDGNLYGTTESGGATGFGTAFRITRSGTLTTLYNFCSQPKCADGAYPYAGLILGIDGSFYGTTEGGGTMGYGTVFKIDSSGTLTTVHHFDSVNGAYPSAGLVQGNDGNLYGTAASGGDASCVGGCGTIFKVTRAGSFVTVHRFDGGGGAYPGAMIQARDGKFYGTTISGGVNDYGTIFKISPRGTLTSLYSFCSQPNCADGLNPQGGLVQAQDGTFYGTTVQGGNTSACGGGCGDIFKFTSYGMLTTLYSFSGFDGAFPLAGLVEGVDGNFYGDTFEGGDRNCYPPLGCGTVFQITARGTLTTVHTFELADGFRPSGGQIEVTNGVFYGTTAQGGDLNCGSGGGCGTVFKLDMGLSPFIAFVRDSAKVGGTGGILGQGFTGTTDVSINGTPAKFKIVSDTFLKATVPNGATTGLVTVTTPSGALTSNKPFRVTPQLLNFDPPSGPVGTQVTITGVSLTQTQDVGFGNRVPAQFTVNSDTQVTATVPVGAKTGKIGIETKGGVAISSGTFIVTP